MIPPILPETTPSPPPPSLLLSTTTLGSREFRRFIDVHVHLPFPVGYEFVRIGKSTCLGVGCLLLLLLLLLLPAVLVSERGTGQASRGSRAGGRVHVHVH